MYVYIHTHIHILYVCGMFTCDWMCGTSLPTPLYLHSCCAVARSEFVRSCVCVSVPVACLSVTLFLSCVCECATCFLSCRVVCCCGVVLVVSCVVPIC